MKRTKRTTEVNRAMETKTKIRIEPETEREKERERETEAMGSGGKSKRWLNRETVKRAREPGQLLARGWVYTGARIPSRLGEPGSLFSRYKFLQLELVVVTLLTRTRRELLKRLANDRLPRVYIRRLP